MKIGILGYILIFFIICILVKLYWESDYFQLKCVISTVDGNKYCVRERNEINKAADLLAKTSTKMKKLVKHLKENNYHEERVKRLVEKFNPKKIKETLPTSEYTAYSENKGEKIAFCLLEKKKEKKLIDENTLTFVALHELAHVMTKSIGHTDEFWENFRYLLEHAENIQIYHPIDYKKNPQEYCGMTINDNPYFDI
tara:strand:- start:1505 stop:2095 length:591 start_codon:yes stop_codon:yes gene_type:complete